MDDREIVKLYLPNSGVAPVDHTAETQTVHRLLDYLETAPPIDAAMGHPLEQYGSVTPWVALQLGCYAELQANQGQLPQALLTAYVSVNAALRCCH